MKKEPSKECYEAMKDAEVPGVSPATFENCGYQAYRTVYTQTTTRMAMRICFINMRAELSLLDHKVAVCGYSGRARPHPFITNAVEFDLILYLKKL